jgi:hypothetical protein
MLLIGLALVSTMLTIIQKQIHALADDVRGKIDKDYQKALIEVDETGGYEQPIEPIDGRESTVALEQGSNSIIFYFISNKVTPEYFRIS